MNPQPVEFHPEAAEELQAAAEWYAERSPRAAEEFVREIDEAIRAISDAPLRWPQFTEGSRRYLVRRFPYLLIYRARGDRLQILAVAHASRRPGYWHGRG